MHFVNTIFVALCKSIPWSKSLRITNEILRISPPKKQIGDMFELRLRYFADSAGPTTDPGGNTAIPQL